MKNKNEEIFGSLTRRQFFVTASGLLVASTGCSNRDTPTNQNAPQASAPPQEDPETNSAVLPMKTLGSLLSFIGGVGTAQGLRGASLFPNPTLKVASGGIALLGGLCSALGSSLDYIQKTDVRREPILTPRNPIRFDPGAGVDENQAEILKEYARRNAWEVVRETKGISSVGDKRLSRFSNSIATSGSCKSPVFVANNKKNTDLYFQLKSDIHIQNEHGDLIINDSGLVYILGYNNQVYLCKIRVLRFLLDEDRCSWTVLSQTEDNEKCPICGCNLLLQEFTDEQNKGGMILKKQYRFGLRDDPKYIDHQRHTGVDDGCKPEIPCGIRAKIPTA